MSRGKRVMVAPAEPQRIVTARAIGVIGHDDARSSPPSERATRRYLVRLVVTVEEFFGDFDRRAERARCDLRFADFHTDLT